MYLKSPFGRGAIAAILLLLLTPAVTSACTCVLMPSTCDTEWKRGEVVFLGKVTAVDPITIGESTMPSRFEIHFSVIESFRGSAGFGQELIIHTGAGGGDCGYPFKVETSYLVYAMFHQKQLTTNICTQTRPEVMAAGIIRELRAERGGGERASIFGTIGTAPRGAGYQDLVESKPLGGVRVSAISSTAQDYSATTDEYGAYSLHSLPADTYRVKVDLPEGLSTRQPDANKSLTVQVGGGAAAAGCRVDVFARPDGRISGVIVDSAGRTVPGFVTIRPADPAEAAVARQRGGLPGYTTEDGRFLLPQIPPGRYQLVFYPKINGQIRFNRGGTLSKDIEIGFGQHIENFQFKVPTLDPSP